jgi:predicted TIM-barrel fold metal-dependent hydrolase
MKRRIIDCHCHLGSYFNFYVPGPTPEDMIKSMDNIGVEKSCISPHMALTSDIVGGNSFMLETVKKYPDRFVGFFTYNPHFPELMKTEMDIAFRVNGVEGIKIHQGTHGTNLMNPAYRYLYDFANRYHLPVLIHTWDIQTIKEIEALSAEYTDTIFIMGHFGALPANMKIAASVINSRNNVVGDTTVSMMFEGNIEWLTDMVGADKVLYGTDMPFIDPRVCLGRILASDLPAAHIDMILGENILRILKGVIKYEI